MTDDSPHGISRRRVLGAVAAVGTAATAGCAGSPLSGSSDSSSPVEIEPEEPSQPRKGTPGEFYALVERNDIAVESLRKDGSELTLRYVSDAETESESTTEIEVIATVYNENLVKNDAGIDVLYAEIADAFDGQARGWGVKTEWCERYNAALAGSSEGGNGTTKTSTGNDTTGGNSTTGTAGGNSTTDTAGGNTTTESEQLSTADTAGMILMSNVLNSRVYEEDLEN